MLKTFYLNFYSQPIAQRQCQKKTNSSWAKRLQNSSKNFATNYRFYKNNICIEEESNAQKTTKKVLITFINKDLEIKYQANLKRAEGIRKLIQELKSRIAYLENLLHEKFYSKVENGVDFAATSQGMILFKKILNKKNNYLTKVAVFQKKLEILLSNEKSMIDQNAQEKKEFLQNKRVAHKNYYNNEIKQTEDYTVSPHHLHKSSWEQKENSQFLFIHQDNLHKKIKTIQNDIENIKIYLETKIKTTNSIKKSNIFKEYLKQINDYHSIINNLFEDNKEILQISLKTEEIIKREKTSGKISVFIKKTYSHLIKIYRSLVILIINMNNFLEEFDEFISSFVIQKNN